ncbi:MAG: long-chain fatty acid--CoA ligase [Proteobacteria bacterium]|nr:long-chain fatty acid--CoA ligase [Pseudomonadota bacterium]
MAGRIDSPNLASLIWEAGERWGDLPAFSSRRPDGTFYSLSYRAWRDRSLALATALIELGVGARDHVAILSDNRFEWILADAAVQFCGAADVPRASDVTAEEIAYILGHADVGVAFVENEAVLAKVESVRDRLPGLRHLIVMAGDADIASTGNFHRLRDLEIAGEGLRVGGDRRAEDRIAGVNPEDLYTIIYTSGTTGVPKGVRLSHGSIISQVRNLPFALGPEDRALSILPVWHIYERVFEMLSVSSGLHTYYTTLRHLGEDLKAARPTIMTSAPRLWEGLHRRILSTVEKAPLIRRALFHAARISSHAVRRAEDFLSGRKVDLTGRSFPVSLALGAFHAAAWLLFILPFLLLDALVLRKLRAVVGGCFRGTISGGGALPPHVDEFFNDIGIPVLEGYGLTESGTVLAVRTWDRLVIGTVGPAFPGTEIRIVDPVTGAILYPDPTRRDLGRGRRGEIHAKGPQMMSGYHKDPEKTALVLRDGWLSTGDLGLVTFNDCIKIVGRCKETIVLLGGENVEPLPIESKLLESPLIDQCMVVGQDQKQLGILVVPSIGGFAAAWIEAPDPAALASRPEVREKIQKEIRRLVSGETGFKPFERIAALELLEKPFEVGDELTMTFKLKRHVIAEKYAGKIAEMFEG